MVGVIFFRKIFIIHPGWRYLKSELRTGINALIIHSGWRNFCKSESWSCLKCAHNANISRPTAPQGHTSKYRHGLKSKIWDQELRIREAEQIKPSTTSPHRVRQNKTKTKTKWLSTEGEPQQQSRETENRETQLNNTTWSCIRPLGKKDKQPTKTNNQNATTLQHHKFCTIPEKAYKL